MAKGDPRDIVWERHAMFPSCAFAGLGDPSLVDDEAWLGHGRLPFLQVRRSGLGMLHGVAECDGLPVELGKDSTVVVAARLEFTNDVAKLERRGIGRWMPLGRLRIGSRGGIAIDAKFAHEDGYHHHLPLPAGFYVAEAFKGPNDHLGIRLVAEHLTSEGVR